MKEVSFEIKDVILNLIQESAKVRGKTESYIINEALENFFIKEKKNLFPQIVFDESKEIWKDIPGYEGMYKASNMGRISSSIKHNFKIMNQMRMVQGYYTVSLIGKAKTTYLTHRLIATTFLPTPCKDCIQVDHINGIKCDNRAENLRWITRSDNTKNNHRLDPSIKDKISAKGKKVELFDNSGNSLGVFSSLNKACEFAGCTISSLSNHLRKAGKYKSTYVTDKKITGKFVEDI